MLSTRTNHAHIHLQIQNAPQHSTSQYSARIARHTEQHTCTVHTYLHIHLLHFVCIRQGQLRSPGFKKKPKATKVRTTILQTVHTHTTLPYAHHEPEFVDAGFLLLLSSPLVFLFCSFVLSLIAITAIIC